MFCRFGIARHCALFSFSLIFVVVRFSGESSTNSMSTFTIFEAFQIHVNTPFVKRCDAVFMHCDALLCGSMKT